MLTFPRLRLYVKDREGTEVPIAFHDGMSGFEFLKEAKKGHTVMVAQAKGHLFMDLSFGLRAEEKDLERVRFVEVGGKKLNEAGKMLAKEREKDEWKCDGCGKVKDKNVDFALSRCGGCKFVRYCNRVSGVLSRSRGLVLTLSCKKCQAQHWSKEHKEACKALREARWFAEKKWLNMGKENKLTPLQEE